MGKRACSEGVCSLTCSREFDARREGRGARTRTVSQRKRSHEIAALKQPGASRPAQYVLRLYVAGITPKSSAAIRAVANVCEERLKGRCALEVVDIFRLPTLAKGERILAVATLITKLPKALRRLIGDMADKDRILVGLDLRPKQRRGSGEGRKRITRPAQPEKRKGRQTRREDTETQRE